MFLLTTVLQETLATFIYSASGQRVNSYKTAAIVKTTEEECVSLCGLCTLLLRTLQPLSWSSFLM